MWSCANKTQLTHFHFQTHALKKNLHAHNCTLCVGYYLSAQLWSHPVGSRVAVVTAVMEPTPDKECLMFWYYMEGNEVGELSVYLQTTDNHVRSALLWTRSGDQGKHWRHGRVTLSSSTLYQVNWLSDNCSWLLSSALFWKASSESLLCGLYTTSVSQLSLLCTRCFEMCNINIFCIFLLRYNILQLIACSSIHNCRYSAIKSISV